MELSPRRLAILRHVARYGVTLRPVIDKLFFQADDGACAAELEALRRGELLASAENAVAEADDPQTRYSYYYLTAAAARQLGVSSYLARPPGTQALARALAVLWFCCADRFRRHRLLETDLVDLFGKAAVYASGPEGRRTLRLKGLHCLHQQHTRFRVYNVYVPKTSVADATVELRKRIRESRAIPPVSDAIDARRYGFALLAESIDQREALRDALAKTLVSEGISFTVVRAPGPWRRKK